MLYYIYYYYYYIKVIYINYTVLSSIIYMMYYDTLL